MLTFYVFNGVCCMLSSYESLPINEPITAYNGIHTETGSDEH